MAKMKLSNGITLDDKEGMAPMLKSWAIKKGIKKARVFMTNDGKRKTYLLVIGTTPEFESTAAEDVACHIDMLALNH